ncbi:MAG: carboxylating nicotinate-nucleotide diphosphorylase [Promethearchaeota archaeon]
MNGMKMENSSEIDRFIIRKKLKEFLEEDLGFGDITSNLIPDKKVKAEIIAKNSGIICGIMEAHIIFGMFGIAIIDSLKDGNKIDKGDSIISLSGNLRDILGVERTVLNIMMRMSSIATSTQKIVNGVKKTGNNLKIAATRKTTPGFRYFEKRAVIIGGGDPHRWRLDDMVMFKDTHLDAFNGTIGELMNTIQKKISFSKKVEMEVENKVDAIKAATANVDIIMFDNMIPEEIKEVINEIKKKSLKNHKKVPIFEASGNITAENILRYADTGVNIISTSEITMNPSIKVDLSLKIRL